MAENTTKLPVKTEAKEARPMQSVQPWRPFESLRREVDRLFSDFDRDFWAPSFLRSAFQMEPFWRRETSWSGAPLVDIVERDDAYEVSAELPGLDEKNIEVRLTDGGLTIRGEKQEEKQEKKRDYHVRERHFGTFERYFTLPDGVDVDKIEASFKKGVLTITMPKKPEAQKSSKRIEIKAG